MLHLSQTASELHIIQLTIEIKKVTSIKWHLSPSETYILNVEILAKLNCHPPLHKCGRTVFMLKQLIVQRAQNFPLISTFCAFIANAVLGSLAQSFTYLFGMKHENQHLN